MNPTPADRERFAELFHELAPRVRSYIRRQVLPSEVDEVVSETFLIAWRRHDQVPAAALPWLLVTARHVIANKRRLHSRRELPAIDLEEVAAGSPAPGADGLVADRATALHALAELTEREREAVLLVAWDGLDNRAAALVAGCSPRAFTVRLHRARRRLAHLLDDLPPERERPRSPLLLAPSPLAPSPRVSSLVSNPVSKDLP